MATKRISLHCKVGSSYERVCGLSFKNTKTGAEVLQSTLLAFSLNGIPWRWRKVTEDYDPEATERGIALLRSLR